jgi:hypothetical protein
MHQQIQPKEKALSYYRFSDPMQSRGDSKRRQEDEAARYAAENNLEIVETFRDEGVSGFRGDNATKGSFGKIIYLARNGMLQAEGIKHIIVEGFDRISRMEVDEAYDQFRDLLKTGMTIHTVKDRRIYTKESLKDAMYLMGSIMIMAQAHTYSSMNSYRLKKRREENRADARNGVKRMTSVCPLWLEPADHYEQDGKEYRFSPIPERVRVVKIIYELAAEGHTIYYIARKLTEDKEPTFRTGKGAAKDGWSTTYISKILKTENVLGTMQPCKLDEKGKPIPDGDPILDYYPPVVSVDLFNRAQAAKRPVNHGKGGGATGKTYTNLFKGLLHCACCSNGERQVTMQVRGMGMGRDRTKEYKYLICAAKRKTANHPVKRNFRYDGFEKLFLDYVTDFDVSRLIPNRTADSKVDDLKVQIADTEYQIKNLKAEEESLGKRLDRAPDERTADYVMERISKKLAEITQAEQTLKELNNQIKILQIKEDRRSRSFETMIALRDQMANATGHDLYEIRSRLAMTIQSIVDDIRFDAETGIIDVTIMGGVKGYRFIDGKFEGSYDLLPQVAAGTMPLEAFTITDNPERRSQIKRLVKGG